MDDFMVGGFRDEAFWHNKGIVREGGWPDAKTAVIDSGVEKVKVHILPLQYTNPYTGELVTVENRFNIVREAVEGIDDNWRVFKTVTGKYRYVTPTTIAEMLDAEPNPLTKTWPVDTIFLLGKGDRFGISLVMEDSFPLGDEEERHQHRLFVADTFRGSGSISVMEIDFRVGCYNTWLRAFNQGTRKMTFPHIGDPAKMLEFRINLEKVALQMRREAVEQFEAMMRYNTTEDQRRDIVEAVFPDPKPQQILAMVNSVEAKHLTPEMLEGVRVDVENANKILERGIERAQIHRVNVMRLFHKFNDEHPKYANTAYALGNAFTEYADWRKGRGANNRPMQILYRGRANEKKKSYKLIMDLMGVKLENEPELEEVALN